ncbi:MAG: tRNA (guanine-N1)-methyltransferase, partial [Candidatus Woesearchaeota archaeon]
SHFETKFDRIVMILPEEAHTFLRETFSVSKKGTIIHLYQFYNEKDIDTKVKRDIEKLTSKLRKVKILDIVKCGPYSPRKFRVCIDIKVL